MKTKLSTIEDNGKQKLNETLVRDGKQLKVKTNIRAGFRIWIKDGGTN